MRGTSEEWAEWEGKNKKNVPLAGEIVIEIDTSINELTGESNRLHKLKIGDGITPYSQLAYVMAGDEIVSQVLPRIVEVELYSSNWIQDDERPGQYYQDIQLDNITPKSRLDL